ncbi:MAG: hypothetical protein LBQ47_03235 [Endomicrobium sp.]|nr:hypothetical protein [Endomicrobium sp.]
MDKPRISHYENLTGTLYIESNAFRTMLIDGSNVIRKMYIPNKSGIDLDKESVLECVLYSYLRENLILRYYNKILLFFDGPQRSFNTQLSNDIFIVFSKSNKADSLILAYLARIRHIPFESKYIQLVTEDRELIQQSKSIIRSICIIRTIRFLKALNSLETAEKP